MWNVSNLKIGQKWPPFERLHRRAFRYIRRYQDQPPPYNTLHGDVNHVIGGECGFRTIDVFSISRWAISNGPFGSGWVGFARVWVEPRRVFKLILGGWRSQPMRKRLRERQPVTARLSIISLKTSWHNYQSVFFRPPPYPTPPHYSQLQLQQIKKSSFEKNSKNSTS